MDKMKIGLVCPYNIHRPGGVLEVVLALKSGLEERGHIVKIITPKPRTHAEQAEPDVIYAGVSTDFRTLLAKDTTAQVSSTADNEKIAEMLAEEKFDILHFHEPWLPLLSRQLLQLSNSVNIGTFHAKVSDGLMSRSILKAVYPYLTSVQKYLHELTAVSESGAAYASTVTDQPITIIPNGIDLTKYQKGSAPYKLSPEQRQTRDRKTILYVGRLEPRKGVKYLLTAFQLLAQDNPNIELLIAGDGPNRERLELLAEDLHLHNVNFLGFISEELKLQLMAEADVFCSPALYGESFGIVLLEAMAAGTVAVAGNNSGYIDLMQDIGALSIVNPEDTSEFARRLEMLLYQEELRDLWQNWAENYVEQFDYKHVVDAYEEFYKEALKRHGHHKH